MSGSVTLECRDRVAILTLRHEARLNAVDLAVAQGLVRATEELGALTGVGAVVLRGAGQRAFCSGLDTTYTRESGDRAQAIRAISATLETFMARLRQLDLPSVSMLHGVCYGGGLHLAIETDFRFADEALACAVPALKNGLYYPVTALARLRALCGPSRVARLLLEGAPMDAQTLLRWGLVDEVVPAARLEEATLAFAGRLAAQPPQAVRDYRAIFHALDEDDLERAAAIRAAALARHAKG